MGRYQVVKCPNCNSALEKSSHLNSICFRCASCGGICIGIAPMRRLCGNQQFLNILWQTARHGYSNPGRPCPHCSQAMRTVTLPLNGIPIELDVCSRCDVIWFDPEEFERLPEAKPEPGKDDDLPPEAKELLAIRQAQVAGDKLDNELSAYENQNSWGRRRGGMLDVSDFSGGGRYAILAMVGIAIVWVIIKAVECISDYRRLKTNSPDQGYDLEPLESKPEPVKKEPKHSSKSYDGDYYKMD